MNKIEKIKELVQELNRYSYEYYTLDNPSVSDKQYDEKYDELVKLEEETNHIEPNSPTQRVGDIVLKGFKKVQHKNKLWSLDKSQSKEELKKFYDDMIKFCKQNKLPTPKFTVLKKFDGLTIKSEYNEQGELKQSSSRGTGEIGEDLTEQSKTIINLPHKINCNHPIHIHGEALMTKRAFNDYNKTAEVSLKNLRNGASGALRNLNVKECAKRKLSVFFYNINYIEGKEFNTYSEQLDYLKGLGLPMAEYKLCETFEEICDEIDNIEKQRPNLEFDIDGVVISVDDIETREKLGFTIKFPKYSMAYKFEAEENTTTLLGIEWNVGRSGRVNPKGILEPVELAGVTVKRATLNNLDDIRKKGVKIGSRIFIRRSNDVIPEIMGVVDINEGEDIIPPTNCPSCGTELVMDGAYLKCSNSLGCKPQAIKSIVHYCQREAMNIEGFSEKTAEQFFENDIISNVLDLYSLESKKDEIIKLPKFGLKKYNNLIESIEKSKQCELSAFIFGLGIANVGKGTSKDLVKHFKTIGGVSRASKLELLKVEDIGETVANDIYSWFNNENNLRLLEDLTEYIEFKTEENKVEISNSDNKLYAKHVYATGKFSLKKDELKKKLEEVGAIVESGYKKSLDYLICGGDMSKSGKGEKALLDGVSIMSEDELMQIIR